MKDYGINVLKLALKDIRKFVPKYTYQELLIDPSSEDERRLMEVDKVLNILGIIDFITLKKGLREAINKNFFAGEKGHE